MIVLLAALACRPTGGDTAPGPATAEAVPLAPGPLGDACGAADSPSAERALVFDGAPPSNLLIISIDTLRKDRVGRYSGGDDTPFLDGLLAESVVLDDLMACANWTLPGVYCAVSGHAMFEAGLEPIDPSRLEAPDYIDPELGTVAGWLAAEGWATSLVTTSKLFSRALPTGNGFAAQVYNPDMDAAAVADAARGALSSLREGAQPWHLQVHFRDPHGPYSPPARYQGDLAGADLGAYDPRSYDGISAIYGGWAGLSGDERAALVEALEALYAGELRYLDDELRALWDDWSASGALDDTLVVLWSDHGEQFFEHDGFQHGDTLHQEEARAVGAFWARNLAPRAFTGPTTHTDIAATILDVYGLPVPEVVSGVPVGALGTGRTRAHVARDKALRPLLSADREGHRLLYAWDGARSYHQTPGDPLEATDLYDADSADVACLWAALAPVLEQIDQRTVGAPVRPGP